jgi:hypothetical protein
MAGLRGLKPSIPTKERRPDPARQLDGSKPFRWVQIVLAALIDDPQVTLPRRVFIGKDSIDLV